MLGAGTRRIARVGVVAAIAALALSGCTNEGTTESTGEGEAAQADGITAEGGCTMEDYGVEAVELEGATIGFSQSEPDSASFRAAETQSIRDAAEEVGAEVIVTNANAELPKQISDIQDLINQGVDILVVAPVNSDGLTPALEAAAEAGIPVITIDRKVNDEACSEYVAFLGSDFYEQGQRAADALAEETDEEANVLVLLGPSGNNVTDGRRDGFVDRIEEAYPDITIVAEQTANASRAEGQDVTAQLLQTNPEIDAVYAFNDESGLGAMTAIQAAGLAPGEDVVIVSVDGTRNAVQAIVDGTYNVTIESNPRFGPLVMETLQAFYDGEAIAEDIIIEDGEYTSENAEEDIDQAF